MGGCERAALDDAARSFRFGKIPSIWPSWPCFAAGLGFSWVKKCIIVNIMYLQVI